MSPSVSETLVFTLISWVTWKLFQRYTFRGPLENIPGPPSSFWTGNFTKAFNRNGWQFQKDMAEKYGGVVKIKAPLNESFLYVFDPKAMHHIVVKDQSAYEKKVEVLSILFGEGLLSTLGEKHKRQRKMMNPVFSTAHMRDMIPIFWEISHKLQDTLVTKVKNGTKEIDIALWMTRMALELVGQSGLGHSFDSMNENDPPHPYTLAVKRLIPIIDRLTPLFGILPVLAKIGPAKFRRWMVNIMPFSTMHELRDITDLMHVTSVDILDTKRKALEDGDGAVARQVARGKDIMSILMRENIEAAEEDKLPEDEVLAQISTLVFAGMDTTSNGLSRIFHLLATHPDVQEKLRREVTEALEKHGDLSYDELVSLPYLDAVIRETLRLYPPVPLSHRVTSQDVILPFSKPVIGVDGREMHEVLVPKGTNVFVSILSANRNPEVWGKDSYEWKPERWLSEIPASLKEAHVPGIYSHLMTFLGGGRACIGFKFSQLEMKVVLALLFKTFKFTPSDKDIFWALSGIAIPTVVGGDSTVPSLPTKLSLV